MARLVEKEVPKRGGSRYYVDIMDRFQTSGQMSSLVELTDEGDPKATTFVQTMRKKLKEQGLGDRVAVSQRGEEVYLERIS